MTATLLALAALLRSPMDEEFAAPISLSEMPAKVERLMHRLRIDDDLIPEEIAAGNKDCCRPYFPLMVMDDVGLKRSQGRTFFVNFYAPRHRERSPVWRKAGRLDLIAESMVVVARGDTAFGDDFAKEWSPIIEELLRNKSPAVVKSKLGDKDRERWSGAEKRFELLEKYTVKKLLGMLSEPKFEKIAAGKLITFARHPMNRAPYGNLDLWALGWNTALFADRLELGGSGFFERSVNIHSECVRIDMAQDGKYKYSKNYFHSLFVSNGDVECGNLENTFILAEGDVVFNPFTMSSNSIVIAGGNITIDKKASIPSFLVAGGKIIAKALTHEDNQVKFLLSKGGLELSDETESKKPDPGREQCLILDGVGPSDFGIRWFELNDVGLEIVAEGKSAIVKAVGEKSPFKDRLLPKDKLISINAVPVATPDAVRRVLRRAVILGFAVVTFERDGKEITRLMHLDDLLAK